MKIVSLFSGAGGLDLGFKRAGFNIVWANEFDSTIFETYAKNHPETFLRKQDIRNIKIQEIPDCDGIIGGAPCQSWSIAGNQKGLDDERGKLFLEFIRIVEAKQPKFFIAENVKGMLLKRHSKDFQEIIYKFSKAGYILNPIVVNAVDFGVPQNRERIFLIGTTNNKTIRISAPEKLKQKLNLRNAIGDLVDNALPAVKNYYTNGTCCIIPNHEYIDLPFPYDYSNYDKVREWDDPSYTIRATGKYALPHPQCPHMHLNKLGKYSFDQEDQSFCRRLTVRECARIQTFPDEFIFYYKNLMDGHKMVGNAVPVNLAFAIAKSIKLSLGSL